MPWEVSPLSGDRASRAPGTARRGLWPSKSVLGGSAFHCAKGFIRRVACPTPSSAASWSKWSRSRVAA
eukprot:2522904-Pyramimonas_sp.AAC.1